MTIACFVSPHGFGHAARICAVLHALQRLVPALHAHIFTTVPEWFFAESLPGAFTYHACLTDIGMVQTSPLHEDIEATVERLDAFLPFHASHVDKLAATVSATAARAVLCDISPLGIAVAATAGLPSVLIENFTWDWIYEGYTADHPRMAVFAQYLAGLFNRATLRIQAEPVCRRVPSAHTVPPISRSPRSSPAATRRALGVPDSTRMVLLTMGGVSHATIPSTVPGQPHDLAIVIPNNVPQLKRNGNLILLPWHSDFYHPDLVAAADVVIGKLGYSTIAEVFSAGTALAWLPRPKFRESAAMAAFVRAAINHVELSEAALENGSWLQAILPLLTRPRCQQERLNGALAAARIIAGLLGSHPLCSKYE